MFVNNLCVNSVWQTAVACLGECFSNEQHFNLILQYYQGDRAGTQNLSLKFQVPAGGI